MPRTGRPKAELTVTDQQRAELLRRVQGPWVQGRPDQGRPDQGRPDQGRPDQGRPDQGRRSQGRRDQGPGSGQAAVLRARIVLACAQGADNAAVAAELGCSAPTVGKWRSRFVREGLAGLVDQDRPGRPLSITNDRVEEVVLATLESAPEDAPHWSRTSMAQKSGLSASTIGRIWRDFGLTPHRSDAARPTLGRFFSEQVIDVVGLYHYPPERAVVLCTEQRVQPSDPPAPVAPALVAPALVAPAPVAPERGGPHRQASTELFAALPGADGISPSHRGIEFRRFLSTVDEAVPQGLDIQVVCDNYATSRSPAVRAWLASHPRVHLHLTPTGSFWLDQAAPWLSYLTEQGEPDGVHALEEEIRRWIPTWTTDPAPFGWTRTAPKTP